jgi:small nuclear ribonucleoprotein (snRNP)-like protein
LYASERTGADYSPPHLGRQLPPLFSVEICSLSLSRPDSRAARGWETHDDDSTILCDDEDFFCVGVSSVVRNPVPQGKLMGFDQTTNIILADSIERIFSVDDLPPERCAAPASEGGKTDNVVASDNLDSERFLDDPNLDSDRRIG